MQYTSTSDSIDFTTESISRIISVRECGDLRVNLTWGEVHQHNFNKPNSFNRLLIAAVLLCSVPSVTNAYQDRDESQSSVNQVLLELDRKINVQKTRVNNFQLKGQLLAGQLKVNFDDIEKQRANIRESLRARYYKETSVATDGNVTIGTSRSFASLPTAASNYFAMVEHAEMKNKQSRTRVLAESYKNLIKTYLIESQELDRLEILKDMAAKGMEINASHLERPSSVKEMNEQNAAKEESDPKKTVAKSSSNRAIGIGTLPGVPNEGDLVAAKSKIIFVLKDRSTADRLLKSPTSFSVRTLEQMVRDGKAAKLSPTSKAVLEYSTDDDQLVRLKISSEDDPSRGFVGWVNRNLLARIKQME